jgi:hypothetical protein
LAAPTPIAELLTRLVSADDRVRRIAVRDLAAAGQEGLAAIVDRLPAETDERTKILMVRVLGEARFVPAMAALARVRDDPATPAALFHAAILAHDRAEAAR